jgi:hypothetical protein
LQAASASCFGQPALMIRFETLEHRPAYARRCHGIDARVARPHASSEDPERVVLHNGVTVEVLPQVFLHASVYGGFPAAVEAFRTAAEVIDAV